MASELDRKYEAVLAAASGPGGPIVIEQDAMGRHYVANFPPTLPQLFSTFAMLYADIEAVVADQERLTFREIESLSNKVALGLIARGIKKGNRVGIAMRNCPAWSISYIAAVKAGAVATLINGWWREDELAHALKLTEPTLILADSERAERVTGCSGQWAIEAININALAADAFADLVAAGASASGLPEVLPDDHATILFTSGSTGKAKGALSTHRQVTAAAYTYVVSLMVLKGILVNDGTPPPERRKALVSVPFFHVTGEVPVMLTNYIIGGTLILMPKWDAGEALRLIEAEKVTAFTGVPTMALEMMNHPDRDKYDLSSLGDINSGGAPRPASHVARQAEEMPTIRSVQGYGLTETNAVGAGIFWQNYRDKPKSTGRAQPPFVEIRIIDDDGNPLPQGETGEIAIRAVATIEGYWKDPAATEAAYTADHFFRSGDIGYLDEDDYLFIVDRKKEIIIRGGENIATAEVEAAIYACKDIEEAAVFGMPDERLGEVPVAIIYARPGSGLDEEGLRAFLDGKLAAFKIPAKMIFSDQPLPRLGTGKIDRVILKQMLRGGR